MSETSTTFLREKVHGPETLDEYFGRWENALVQTILNREFGSYCHEGYDLVEDTEIRLRETIHDRTLRDIIEALSSKIVWEYEEKECNYCNESVEGEE